MAWPGSLEASSYRTVSEPLSQICDRPNLTYVIKHDAAELQQPFLSVSREPLILLNGFEGGLLVLLLVLLLGRCRGLVALGCWTLFLLGLNIDLLGLFVVP